jgi:hypothetical protein
MPAVLGVVFERCWPRWRDQARADADRRHELVGAVGRRIAVVAEDT